MKNTILSILQCCDIIRDLNEEFQKPFGWMKFKEKRECKKLKSELIKMIDSLKDEIWNIQYLKNLENALLLYYDKLEDYIEEISISNHNSFSQSINKFEPIYFSDIYNDKMYILEIRGNSNIVFTIVNIKTGKSLEIISGDTTNASQKKVEMQCKEKIISSLNNYLENISVDRKSASLNLMQKVKQDIQI